MSILTLSSCFGNNDGQGGSPVVGNEVYVQGTVMRIVTSADSDFSLTAELTAAVKAATGILPQSILDASEAAAHELVIGHTSREVTRLAEEYMNALGIVSNDTSAYCIYVKGGSVAVVWSHDIAALEQLAFDRLVTDLLSGESLYLEDGVVCHGTFDRRAHEDAREAALRESQLDEVERILGKDARDAMADYLEMYSDDYYIWLANLYDPEIGGFYYANSGRDTEGFLPDIESTVQALSWIQEVGFLEFYGGNLALGLPEWMKEQIIGFAQSLQSSVDGYFYHPQWGNNITDSRKGRDLDWAVRIIPELGGQILYDTPSGIKGSLGAPSGVTPTAANLTAPLACDKVTACASAVAAVASVPSHLSSLSAFRSYLESFDWENDSYTAGHTAGTQCSQVRNRGKEYVDLFIGFLNEKQEAAQQRLRAAGKAENGLWEDRISYDSVNGLMKISGIYNDLGAKIPYAEQALASAISLVEFEGVDVEGKRASNAVDVFNPLYAIGNLFTNISKYYEGDEADYYRGILRENAASIIRATKRKAAVFAKPDGAYGYNDSKVTADSQGAPVAIEGINESDVNGAGMVTNGIFRCMCNALGITPLYRYFNSDYENFLSIIESLSPVVKQPVTLSSEPVSFDGDAIGTTEPENISSEMNTGSIKVINDPRSGVSGNVLEFLTKNGASSKLTTNIIGTGVGNCFVLEWDMNIKKSQVNTVAMRAKLGYSYLINVKTSSSGYTIGDSSGTSGPIVEQWFNGSYAYDTWYTFRIEHYTGDAESVRSVIYVNGKRVAESDNYYGKSADGSKIDPLPLYNHAAFFALSSADMTVYLDNIRAEKLERTYSDDKPTDPIAPVGVTVDFEGTKELPDEITCKTNGQQGSAFAVISDPTAQGGDNSVLHMTATGAPVGGTGNSIKVNSVWSESPSANCYVASADFYFVTLPDTTAFQLFIRNGDDRNIYCLNFDTKTDSDGKRYLRIYEKPEGDTTSSTIVDWFDVSDWVNIRVEYYKDKKIAKIYINDVCVAENGAFWNSSNATADFTVLTFAALRATTAELYIDNLTAQKIVKTYRPES